MKVQRELSEEIVEYPGVSRGAKSSTDLFKMKSNPMLRRASTYPLAYRIGPIPVGAPTTADDTALIAASRLGVQILIGISLTDANQQRCNFSARNTKLISEPQVKLNGSVIEVSTQEQHLGIERVPSNNSRATVQCRIK